MTFLDRRSFEDFEGLEEAKMEKEKILMPYRAALQQSSLHLIRTNIFQKIIVHMY